MTKDTSGPAFPCHPGIENSIYDGMTLRDYFAARAMPMAWDYTRRIEMGEANGSEDKNECRYLIHVDPEEEDDDCVFVASLAYRIADAMLQVRQE